MCYNAEKVDVRCYTGEGLQALSSCGYCSECYKSRGGAWQVRLHYEALDNPPEYAVVLTYAGKGKDTPTVLNYRDVQLFHKRLRKAGYSFRYFVSGEYGEDKGRPHYHELLFSVSPAPKLKLKERKLNGHHVYSCSELSKYWPHGLVFFQLVEGLSGLVSYMSKYFQKQLFSCDAICDIVNRLPQFQGDAAVHTWKELKASVDDEMLRYIKSIRPRHLFSQSLGYNSWLKRIDDYVKNGGVWIDGRLCNIPVSWLKKYCAPLVSADYLARMQSNGKSIDVGRAKEAFERRKKAKDDGVYDLTYEPWELKYYEGLYNSLVRNTKAMQLPVGKHAIHLFREYKANIAELDIDLEVFDSSNRAEKFDHLGFIQSLLGKEF